MKECGCDIYTKAVSVYGIQSRMILAMEEMAELTKELSKNIRGKQNTSAISEEIADVEIMLEQLKIIFNNRSQIDCYRSEKLNRLSRRIEKSGCDENITLCMNCE